MIKALSFKEPFASLMLHGKIETRTWDTSYRGLVLICASKQPYSTKEVKEISKALFGKIREIIPHPRHLQTYGKAIAVGRLVDSRPMSKDDEAKCFVEYHPGLWCHVYADVVPIYHFDWKGQLGFKKLTEEEESKIIWK